MVRADAFSCTRAHMYEYTYACMYVGRHPLFIPKLAKRRGTLLLSGSAFGEQWRPQGEQFRRARKMAV
jgi:hypothetical protein